MSTSASSTEMAEPAAESSCGSKHPSDDDVSSQDSSISPPGPPAPPPARNPWPPNRAPNPQAGSRTATWFEVLLASDPENPVWMTMFRVKRAVFDCICILLHDHVLVERIKDEVKVKLEVQIGVTIYHLISGVKLSQLAGIFAIDLAVLDVVLDNCVAAMIDRLADFLGHEWPSPSRMEGVQEIFEEKCSLARCHGVLGFTRVSLSLSDRSLSYPPAPGELEMAVLAVCDAAGQWIYVKTSYPGSTPDADVMKTSFLYWRANAGLMLRDTNSQQSVEVHDTESVYSDVEDSSSEAVYRLDPKQPYLITNADLEPAPWLYFPAVPENERRHREDSPIDKHTIALHIEARNVIDDAFQDARHRLCSLVTGVCCTRRTAHSYVKACFILHNMIRICLS